jgi:HK97 family phage major capsid protein
MNELVGKRERLQDLQKQWLEATGQAGQDIDFSKMEKIGSEDVKGLTSMAKVEKLATLNSEMEALGPEVDALAAAEKSIRESRMKAEHPAPKPAIIHPAGGDLPTKSFGRQMVESAWYQHIKEHGARAARDAPASQLAYGIKELKTLFQTTAGFSPESVRSGRLVEAVTRPLQVLDLFPTAPTGQAAYVHMEETTRTHSAAEKGEGLAFAESTFVWTQRSSTVRKITDSLPFTDEQVEDEPAMQSYMADRIQFGLRQRLDLQTLVGDGSGVNLTGILNTGGISTQAKGADPTFDTAMKALTLVRVTGRANPTAFVFHPNDWQTIKLTRTADGIYIMGNPTDSGVERLWGIPVAISDAITENTGLVGDFATFSGLFERAGVDIQTGYTGAQFTEGEKTIRGTLRVAFVVFRAAAFCTMTGI